MTEYDFMLHLDKIQINGAVGHGADTVLGSPRTWIEPSGTGILPSYDATNNAGWDVELVANCTALALFGWIGGDFSCSIDGAAAQNIASADTDNYVATTVATGLAAGKHLFRFKLRTFRWISVQLTGGTEAIVSVPKRIGFFNNATYPFTNYARNSSDTTSPAAVWGSGLADTNGPGHSMWTFGGCYIRFSFSGRALEIMAQSMSGAAEWQTRTDGGADTYLNPTLPNLTFVWERMADGLTAASHTFDALNIYTSKAIAYRVLTGAKVATTATAGATSIVLDNTDSYSIGDWIELGKHTTYEVRQIASIVGSTIIVAATTYDHPSGELAPNYASSAGTLTPVSLPSFTKNVFIHGDSNSHAISEGAGYSFYDRTFAWCYRALDLGLGRDHYRLTNLAVQGWKSSEINPADVTAYGAGSDIMVFMMGTNDFGQNVTTATYNTNMTAAVQAAKTVLNPGGTILLCQVFQARNTATNGNGDAKTAFDAVLQSIATSESIDGTDVRFYDGIFEGIPLTAGAYHDGLHFTALGQETMSDNFLEFVDPEPPPTPPSSSSFRKFGAAGMMEQMRHAGMVPS